MCGSTSTRSHVCGMVIVFQLRSVAANLCVDTKYREGNDRFGLEPCTKDNPGLGGEQVASFSLSVCLSEHSAFHPSGVGKSSTSLTGWG